MTTAKTDEIWPRMRRYLGQLAGDLNHDGVVDAKDVQLWLEGDQDIATWGAIATNMGKTAPPLLLDGMDHVEHPPLGLQRVRTTGSGWFNPANVGKHWRERMPTLERVREDAQAAAEAGFRVFMLDVETSLWEFTSADDFRMYCIELALRYDAIRAAGLGAGHVGQFPWWEDYDLPKDLANAIILDVIIPKIDFLSHTWYCLAKDACIRAANNWHETVRAWNRPTLAYVNPDRRVEGEWQGKADLGRWVEHVATLKQAADGVILWGDEPQKDWELGDDEWLDSTWFWVLVAMRAWGLRQRPAWLPRLNGAIA